MLVSLIDKKRAADKPMCIYITDDGESGNWLYYIIGLQRTCQGDGLEIIGLSSDIANEQVRLWRMHSEPLTTHNNPLIEFSGTLL